MYSPIDDKRYNVCKRFWHTTVFFRYKYFYKHKRRQVYKNKNKKEDENSDSKEEVTKNRKKEIQRIPNILYGECFYFQQFHRTLHIFWQIGQ